MKLNQRYINSGRLVISQCAVEDMFFSKAMFDQVFAIQNHIYWPAFEQAIGRIYEMLKAAGVLHIICEKDKIFYHLPQYLEKPQMFDLMHKTGFGDVQIYETDKWIQYQCIKL